MATSSRSRRALEARSGGKIVRARRTAGSRTPYERPRLANPEPESPNWISKLIFSPSRAIATGAGKLISSVFSQDDDDDSSSSSSSSSGSDFSSEENVDNDYYDEDEDVSSHGTDTVKELNQSNGKREIIKGFRKDPEPTIGKRDSKRAIEELLMQETFTREEGDKLIRIIKARVVDGFSTKDAETGGLNEIARYTSEEADEQDLRCTAVMEAKKWLSAKKLRSASKSDVDDVTDNEAGSPVDMAKLYMRTRPQWASPSFRHGESISPLPIRTHLFKEETPLSIGFNALSSYKAKRDTPTTGSWSIQEEIQKVRVKATEEMLRNLPSKKIDWSSRGSPICLLAKNIDANVVENVDTSTRPVDSSLLTLTGTFSTHGFQGIEKAPDGLPNEGTKDGVEEIESDEQRFQSSQDIETRTIWCSDSGTGGVSNHKDVSATEKQHKDTIEEGSVQDPRSLESNYTSSKVAGNKSAHTSNGLPPSGNRLSTEVVNEQDATLDGKEHDLVDSTYDKLADGVFEESCELLSEASVEVPYVSDAMNENDYIINGSPNVAQRYSTRQGSKRSLAPNATGDIEKQQGKKLSRYNRRKQGISTP